MRISRSADLFRERNDATEIEGGRSSEKQPHVGNGGTPPGASSPRWNQSDVKLSGEDSLDRGDARSKDTAELFTSAPG